MTDEYDYEDGDDPTLVWTVLYSNEVGDDWYISYGCWCDVTWEEAHTKAMEDANNEVYGRLYKNRRIYESEYTYFTTGRPIASNLCLSD
jgi:hypothetical protein